MRGEPCSAVQHAGGGATSMDPVGLDMPILDLRVRTLGGNLRRPLASPSHIAASFSEVPAVSDLMPRCVRCCTRRTRTLNDTEGPNGEHEHRMLSALSVTTYKSLKGYLQLDYSRSNCYQPLFIRPRVPSNVPRAHSTFAVNSTFAKSKVLVAERRRAADLMEARCTGECFTYHARRNCTGRRTRQ